MRDREMEDRERLGIIGVLLVAGALCGLLTMLDGCTPTTQRQALVTATQAVGELAGPGSTAICDAVERRCTVDPCPGLQRCHEGQRALRRAAVLWAQGARALNSLLPEED